MVMRLFIATVAGDLSGEETRELARAEKNIADALEALSMQILTAAEKRAQRLGVTDIQLQLGWGDAAQSIMEIATREAADAIMFGRRGRGRLAGWPTARKRFPESSEPRSVYRDHRSKTAQGVKPPATFQCPRGHVNRKLGQRAIDDDREPDFARALGCTLSNICIR